MQPCRWARALKKYKKGVELIEHDDQFGEQEKKSSAEIKKSCNLNLAATYLKTKDSKEARKACNKVHLPTTAPGSTAAALLHSMQSSTHHPVAAEHCLKLSRASSFCMQKPVGTMRQQDRVSAHKCTHKHTFSEPLPAS